MSQLLEVNCPQCKIVFSYYSSPFRPFCCERCKMIDLGHWFEESYRVPEKECIQESKDTNEQVENEKKSRSKEEDDEAGIDEEDYNPNEY